MHKYIRVRSQQYYLQRLVKYMLVIRNLKTIFDAFRRRRSFGMITKCFYLYYTMYRFRMKVPNMEVRHVRYLHHSITFKYMGNMQKFEWQAHDHIRPFLRFWLHKRQMRMAVLLFRAWLVTIQKQIRSVLKQKQTRFMITKNAFIKEFQVYSQDL